MWELESRIRTLEQTMTRLQVPVLKASQRAQRAVQAIGAAGNGIQTPEGIETYCGQWPQILTVNVKNLLIPGFLSNQIPAGGPIQWDSATSRWCGAITLPAHPAASVYHVFGSCPDADPSDNPTAIVVQMDAQFNVSVQYLGCNTAVFPNAGFLAVSPPADATGDAVFGADTLTDGPRGPNTVNCNVPLISWYTGFPVEGIAGPRLIAGFTYFEISPRP